MTGLAGFTVSSPMRAVARLTWPFFLSAAFSYLVLLGLVAVLGRMGGEALLARSVYQPVAFLVLALGFGLTVANQVGAATLRGDPGQVMATTLAIARVWLLAWAVLGLVVFVTAPALARAFGAGDEQVVAFLRWSAVAEFSIVGAGLCAAALRGSGHSRAGSLVDAAVAATRISVAAGLGLGLGAGPLAVPIGAGAAAVIGTSVGLVLLRGKDFRLRRGPLPDVRPLLRRVAVPVALSLGVVAAFTLALLSLLTPFGPSVLAGYAIAASVQNFLNLPAQVIGAATAIVVNRGQPDAVRSGLRLATAIYVVVGAVTWTVSETLTQVMSSDPAVAAEAARYLGIVALTFAIQGPVHATLTIMEHTGRGMTAIAVNLVWFAVIVSVAGVWSSSTGDVVDVYRAVALCSVLGVAVPIVFWRRAKAG